MTFIRIFGRCRRSVLRSGLRFHRRRQNNLQPEFQGIGFSILRTTVHVSLGQTPTGSAAAFLRWCDPDRIVVHVQSILYSSLASSLPAAFIAILGKQWLNRYSQVEMRISVYQSQPASTTEDERRGSLVFRSHHRMSAPYASSCAPAPRLRPFKPPFLHQQGRRQYPHRVHLVRSPLLPCHQLHRHPFLQLPIPNAPLPHHSPVNPLRQRPQEVPREVWKVVKTPVLPEEEKRPRPKSAGGPWSLPKFGTFDRGNAGNHIELPMTNTSKAPTPLFNKETDWHGFVLDSNCIAWMFRMSMDVDVIMAIMKFIPEVV